MLEFIGLLIVWVLLYKLFARKRPTGDTFLVKAPSGNYYVMREHVQPEPDALPHNVIPLRRR